MRLFILGALLSIDLAISEGDKLKATMQLSKGFLLRSEFIAMLLVRNSSSTLGKVSKKVKAWSANPLSLSKANESQSYPEKKVKDLPLYSAIFSEIEWKKSS
jgi:hypothetical protein